MTKYWNQGAGHGDHALGPALPAPAEGSYVRVPTPGAPRDMVLTDLQPGDLLLMSAPDRAHVAVYLGQGQTIEADSDGVVIQALTDALQDDRLAAAWRRTDFNADDAQALVRWLRTQEGRPYESAPQLLSGGNDDEAWYCSELVFTGFDTIGKPLVEADAGLDLPGAALTLTSVDYVGHIKRPGREQPMPQPPSRPRQPRSRVQIRR